MKRSTSPLRAAASRANGSKSHAPVTAIGKYNSSLNSTRHGHLSRSLVLPGELADLFRQQHDDFMEEHQPRTPTERALVEEMVTSWWRKQRIWGMESARITHQVKLSASMGHVVPVTDPATRTALAVGFLADSGRSLDLFLRYETRYERQFHRALARLLDLKSRDVNPPSVLPSRDGNGAVHYPPTLPPDPPAPDLPIRSSTPAAATPQNRQISTGTSEVIEITRPRPSAPPIPEPPPSPDPAAAVDPTPVAPDV